MFDMLLSIILFVIAYAFIGCLVSYIFCDWFLVGYSTNVRILIAITWPISVPLLLLRKAISGLNFIKIGFVQKKWLISIHHAFKEYVYMLIHGEGY